MPEAIQVTAAHVELVAADAGRRTITGRVVPWDVYRTVSTGQTIAFPPGSVATAAMALSRGHYQPAVGRLAAAMDAADGLIAQFLVDPGPAGDQLLADAPTLAMSIEAEITDWVDNPDGSMRAVSATANVALVPRGAFEDAVIMNVAAQAPEPEDEPGNPEGDPPMPDVVETPAPVPAPAPATAVAAAPDPGPAVLQHGAPRVSVAAEPFPYTFDGTGHSFVRDIAAMAEDPEGVARIRRAQSMLADPRAIVAASQQIAAGRRRVAAATGTTVTQPSIIPPGYRPDLFTPLTDYEAPIWSSLRKAPISNFSPFTIPKEATRTGLSGVPADEVTPVAAGDITTSLATVTPAHVMGKYQFSRDLDLASNPAIDAIAMNAMDEEWLKDVETRAATFFTSAGNFTVRSATYADGHGFILAMRAALARFRTTRHATATAIITPAQKEWEAALAADDTAGRPLLGWGNQVINPVGGQDDAAAAANLLGVALLPDGAGPLPAAKTLMLRSEDAWAFTTPMWNFRFESDATNPLVITLVKYSGVAFWTRRQIGVNLITNTTPIVFGDDEGDNEPAGKKR